MIATPLPTTLAQAHVELDRIEAELTRRRWAADPSDWAHEKLHDTLWSGQRRILNAVRDHRRTAAATCHSVGKSYSAALLSAWWSDTHKPGESFVVTTAPTDAQVEVILWKEIGRAHARGKLRGRLNTKEWILAIERNGIKREEIIAMGRKPNDYEPTAFQGIHAPFVLVIVDEANGVRGPLWEAIDSLIANDGSKIVAIGNPDDPSGEFYDHCKPGSGWEVVHLNAFESPNFTGEPLPQPILRQLIGRTYVEEKRRKWAPRWYWVDQRGHRCESAQGVQCVPPDGAKPEDTNPMWQSKILGVFPERLEAGGLIPMTWIRAAQQRTLPPGVPNELGVDIGAGGDESAVCHRRGSVYRIIRTDHEPDTMKQTGKIVDDLRQTGASVAKVDKIGIGWGVVNRGHELHEMHPTSIPDFLGINVGEAPADDALASDDRFLNLKAQLYWNLRDLFERGDIDIELEDEDLAAELVSIRYERMSTGKIKISDKRKDGSGKPAPSPNRAESLMLAAAPAVEEDEWVTF